MVKCALEKAQGYKIESMDREIDQLVFELYGLSEEEIKIVKEIRLDEFSHLK